MDEASIYGMEVDSGYVSQYKYRLTPVKTLKAGAHDKEPRPGGNVVSVLVQDGRVEGGHELPELLTLCGHYSEHVLLGYLGSLGPCADYPGQVRHGQPSFP